MKNLLKVLVASMFALMISVNVSAQEKGDMAVGANVGIAAGNGFTNVGVAAKYQYVLTDNVGIGKIRGEGLFGYYFGDGKYWDLSVNAHYLINIKSVENLSVYPLVGLSFNGFKGGVEIDPDTDPIWEGAIDIDDNGNEVSVGLNIGGGVEYKLTDNISVGAEVKYRLGSNEFNWFSPLVGVTYRF